jgi:hypothetical protein
MGKTDIRRDRPGVIGQRVEKTPWLKARKVECDENVSLGSPPRSAAGATDPERDQAAEGRASVSSQATAKARSEERSRKSGGA